MGTAPCPEAACVAGRAGVAAAAGAPSGVEEAVVSEEGGEKPAARSARRQQSAARAQSEPLAAELRVVVSWVAVSVSEEVEEDVEVAPLLEDKRRASKSAR